MKDWWKKLNKLALLPKEEKKAFYHVTWNMLQITIALKLLNFPSFKKFYRSISKKTTGNISEKKYIQAIKRFSSIKPKLFSCLPQALCFKKQFQDSKLIIGVQASNTVNLDAHAWVERKGEFLIGEIPNFDYLPLWIWE
ncbi:lasso peptide biosynthesis B2 protein [Arcticibacterium luteifluviistationis]|uniref:Lasso peptide biosynthesis B2 protein n=1 Tax=Arcticibacterium luteifluviistationis TaxID=1784714 RepID=A0A2Z4G8Z0_9BACT|nr:lasso peptide biosynthesis B2 protein [Arcticibacterium luteifluviistationis]AWV97403.1 lasso peptide biosynthesis B2 protein [Arcticibacterium luteifluviistationis]